MGAGLNLVNELWEILSEQLIERDELDVKSWHIYLILCSIMNAAFDDAELNQRLINYLSDLPEGAEKEAFIRAKKEQTNIRTRKLLYP